MMNIITAQKGREAAKLFEEQSGYGLIWRTPDEAAVAETKQQARDARETRLKKPAI
jgi:hypothetical protein